MLVEQHEIDEQQRGGGQAFCRHRSNGLPARRSRRGPRGRRASLRGGEGDTARATWRDAHQPDARGASGGPPPHIARERSLRASPGPSFVAQKLLAHPCLPPRCHRAARTCVVRAAGARCRAATSERHHCTSRALAAGLPGPDVPHARRRGAADTRSRPAASALAGASAESDHTASLVPPANRRMPLLDPPHVPIACRTR